MLYFMYNCTGQLENGLYKRSQVRVHQRMHEV